jgi:hypothetical protein
LKEVFREVGAYDSQYHPAEPPGGGSVSLLLGT